MLAPTPKPTAEERRASQHCANVEECQPFLDKSIALGFPPAEDAHVIERYYARKHARGEFGAYWPLHEVKKGYGVLRSMRSDKDKPNRRK